MMKINSLKSLMMIGSLAAVLALAGCGNGSINATTESATSSSAASTSTSTATADDLLTTEASSSVSGVSGAASDAAVVTPEVITATEVTPTETPTPTPTETPVEEKTEYTVAGINFRATAEDDGDIIDTIEPGETVTVLGTEGEWSKISYNGSTGYVATRFLTEDKEEAQDAADEYYADEDYGEGNEGDDSYDSSEDNTDNAE
ncbi:MAG: SH3 domain-containing protein [Lachnospiraceae bacterium]|nr:SH3 domain-containing protein [Lachnospiraceae bacterium]